LPREDALKYYTYLTKKLFHGIDEAVPSISQVMRWLQEVVRDQKGVGLEWESPVGFPVHHDYQKFKTRTVRLNSCGVKTVLVREPTDGVNNRSMVNAVSPNLVHSLDAAHLTMVADSMRGLGYSMVGVHDSFGTHPCDVQHMNSIIRRRFVELYSNDILGEFAEQVGTELPPPDRGKFDVREV